MIERTHLPPFALLGTYGAGGGYADCYTTELPGAYSHAEFVEAFYTSWLFKLERFVLATLVNRPSTDDDARELAHEERASFAAWSVEGRAPDQILLRDFQGRTRSWLMVERTPRDFAARTRLYFGSAIVPASHATSGERRRGGGFRMMLGFHKLYSRALLAAARARLGRRPRQFAM